MEFLTDFSIRNPLKKGISNGNQPFFNGKFHWKETFFCSVNIFGLANHSGNLAIFHFSGVFNLVKIGNASEWSLQLRNDWCLSQCSSIFTTPRLQVAVRISTSTISNALILSADIFKILPTICIVIRSLLLILDLNIRVELWELVKLSNASNLFDRNRVECSN